MYVWENLNNVQCEAEVKLMHYISVDPSAERRNAVSLSANFLRITFLMQIKSLIFNINKSINTFSAHLNMFHTANTFFPDISTIKVAVNILLCISSTHLLVCPSKQICWPVPVSGFFVLKSI